MSYNRQGPGQDPSHAADGGAQDWVGAHRGLGRGRHIDGARDQRRSFSNEHHGPPGSAGGGNARAQYSRWAPEPRGRSGDYGREWEQAHRARDHTPSRAPARDLAYDEPRHAGARHDRAPPFSRRATEPGESLEEGEVEERRIPRPVPTRTFTTPGDVGAYHRRDSHVSRHDRPPAPQQSATYRRAPERNPPLYRTDGITVRTPTPSSPMRLGTKPAARTPSPPLVRRASVADRTLASGSMVRARTNTALAMELAWGVVDAKGKASSEPTEKTPSPKAEPADAGRRSSPTIPQLQSRISDIDREIAECKERLVQMSSTAVAAEQSAASEESKRVPGDDRAVPTSPPFKQAIAPVKDSMRAGAEVAAALVQKCVPGADLAALVVPQTAAGKSDVAEQPRKKASPGPHSDGEQSAAEGSGPEDGDGPRLEEKDMMQTIYHENQARAAAENARFAAPFLECWPTFVPGTYAEPADWPFWEESGRIHEQIKPHLAMILAREKLQAQSHRLRLQREYSTLYAKWRRRVDRLDRQREQRQTVGTTPTPSGAFGTGYRRRAGPANSVDEFGFSLGALFSATPVVDAADDPFKSDAVHSEAELMAIIERLQHDDARNPDLRSQRTAAIIPDMVADPKQRVLLQFNNSSHLIEDPMPFYHAKVPEAGTSQHKRVAYANNGDTGRYWTQAEASAFVTAYLTYPKQFGKIAAHIPHKTMNDCVLFYYRNKKPLRLKELEAKANRAARRSRQTTSSRRRKERERRARKTQEERERLAMEAAAECAPTDHSVGTKTSDDEATVDTTGILERRSRGNALLRSIINANRERKRESLDKAGSLLAMDGSVTGIDDLTPAIYTPDDELSDDMSPTAPVQPTLATDQRGLPATAAVTAAAVAAVAEAAAGEAVEVAAEASEDADDDDDDDDEGDEDDDDDDDDDEEDEEEEGELVEDAQWEPRRLHARDNGRAGSDSDEIVEASGVVAERSSPLIVSRRSQSRFGAMFTAVLDDSQCSLPTRTPEAADSLRESALDRFVAEHPAPRRPLSSHGTLRICHTDGGDEARLDAVVDEQAGEQDEILVGAAVWQLGDRRRVLRALHRLGADFAQVASLMPSKTTAQCRYFYYHYRTPAGALISEVISGASPKKAPAIPQPDALVLPPALSANANASTGTGTSTSTSGHAGGAGSQLLVPEMPAPKRARTLSPTGSDDSNDDDDDEMPLATQLAEELAALQPPHHASELVLVRPTAASPLAATPVPGLVLPRPAPSGMSPVQPLTGTSNPSPHTATAKKSGYSSYWSVHERSAFMHHVSRLGQNWLALADAIGSKTATQVRNYFRANREKLGLDVIIIEYERNRAAGTLPPPVPFTPVSAKDEAQARKEKRGRKRKGDAAKSPRAGSPEEPANTASTPNTAPANMTSFPTMGVDGGRAVVFARPPLPAAEPRSPKPAAPHPPMHDRPPAPSYSLPAGQQLPRLHPWGRPPQHHSLPLPTGSAQQQQPPHVAIRLVSEPSAEIDLRASVAGRDDSSTPLSQPTPPPVEGLRLSSSPGPGAVPAIASSRGRQMSVLNIANLTESTAAPVPRPSLPEEPRKVSVTKINALLNDDSPGASHVSSDWFNDDPAPASQAEDEATGIAALALASMMGAARSSHQPAFQPRQQQQPPRQQHQEPLPRLQQRQQQPLPLLQPQPQSQMRTAAVSAFSPVVNTTMSPADFTMTRPSSTGPSTYTGPMRQRKPSAPPQPTTTLFPPRASFSSYHQHAMMSPLAGPSEVPLVRTPTLLPSQGMARQPYSPHMGARPGTYPEPPHPRYPEPMERHQSPRPHYAPHQHYYYPPLSPGRQQHQHQHQQQHQQQHHLQQRQQPGHAPGSQGYHPPPHHNSMPPYHHHHHPAPPPPPM